jgi:hypothetical protein
VEKKPGKRTVYNFEVQDNHSYFVGDRDNPKIHEAVWVHNYGDAFNHFMPRALGNGLRYGHRALTWLLAADHAAFHTELNAYLAGITKQVGGNLVDMLPRRGNAGTAIQRNFTLAERTAAMDTFMRQWRGGAFHQNFLNEVAAAVAAGLLQ